MSKHRLLLVDDSPQMLKSLLRVFHEDDYNILTADSAKKALKCLETENVELIISDYSMPEISGVDLLKLVKVKYPHIIRIMLTGLTEFDVIKEAINKGEIYRFFNKPVDDFELRLSVRYAFQQRDLEIENNVLKNKLKIHETQLEKLERDYPGITQKVTSPDGSIIIESD